MAAREVKNSVNMEDISCIRAAQTAFDSGKYLEASGLYDKLLDSDPQNLKLLLGKANCLVFLGLWSECLKYLVKAVRSKDWRSTLCLNNLVRNVLKALKEKEVSLQPAAGLCIAREIQSNLLCEICRQIINSPTTLLCGHSFCKQCILKRERKCSYCFHVHCGSDDELFLNFTLTNVVQSCFERKTKAAELRQKGNDHCHQHNYQEAYKKYNESLELDPNNHLTLSNLSHVASALGDYQTALDYAEKICSIMPQWEKGFYRKACALAGLKSYSKAAIAYLQLLRINPKNGVAIESLSKVMLEMLTSGNIVHTTPGHAENKDEALNKILNDFALFLDSLMDKQSSETKDFNLINKFVNENGSLLSEKLSVDDLECSLCCRIFYKPVTCSCGHTFCQCCLNRCLDHNPCCPVCRYPVDKYIGGRNQNVTVMIELLCEKYFPKEYEERKQRQEEEMKKLASVAMDTTETIPVFVCVLALPTIACPLHIFEPRYRLMVRECMESGSMQFGMCIPSQDSNFADYGVMLEIHNVSLLSDGRSLVESVGGRRFKVLSRDMKDGYNIAMVEWLKDQSIPEDELVGFTQRQLEVYEIVKNWLSSLPMLVKVQLSMQRASYIIPDCDYDNVNLRNGPNWIWWCLNLLPMENTVKLEIVAMIDVRQRLNRIQAFFTSSLNN